MWLMIFAVVALVAVIGVIFLVRQFHRFQCFQRLSEKHRLLSWILAALPVAALSLIWFVAKYSVFIIIIHLALIWLLCNLTAYLISKRRKRQSAHYYAGGAALLLTALIMGIGWFFAHHIYETDYQITSAHTANGESLRVAFIADSHLSVTLDGKKFSAVLSEIESKQPDALLIGGDFVDDDTTREDMLAACEALGKMQTTYGVYYVFGNHDRGYYSYRDFTTDELLQTLRENGITVLKDETAELGEHFSVTGRLDLSMKPRKDAAKLAADTDSSRYRILLDHQPTDYDAEAQAGFDLVLSGHTHGGHIFPAGQIGLLISENDALYGQERRGDTDFIITSGISGWAIPFKTGCISEYCIIDIKA